MVCLLEELNVLGYITGWTTLMEGSPNTGSQHPALYELSEREGEGISRNENGLCPGSGEEIREDVSG